MSDTAQADRLIRSLRSIVAALYDDVRRQHGEAGVNDADEAELYRVAFFAMTRLLLGQMWADLGPIDQFLDAHGSQYRWYRLSDNVQAAAAAELSTHDLARVSCDVLGPVYEQYLDQHERKNKGQYYTPRAIVRFLWDRVGFTSPASLFPIEGGRRCPPVIFDFCAGSGGFLVEAARRLREAALPPGLDPSDKTSLAGVSMDDLHLAEIAIAEGLRGSEITTFACFLTEVNLLIQLTPLWKAMKAKCPDFRPRSLALPILHDDGLKLHSADDASGSEAIADYVCSNPPYIGEKGNKELFRKVRQTMPYWNRHYQGKMDYLYWFIILGLSKLRNGGRLGYITTAYWPTADGASKLRAYLLENAKILEIIDSGPARLFSDAGGQHNMILVAERCANKADRDSHRPKLVQVKADCPSDSAGIANWLCHLQQRMAIAPGESYDDESLRVFWSPAVQGELNDRPWHIFHEPATERLLRQIASRGERLTTVLRDAQGVVSGADKVAPQHLRHLPAEVADHVRIGDGIFVLSQAEVDALDLSAEERRLLKPTYKNSHVGRYAIDPSRDEPEHLLYLTRGCGFSSEATPRLFAHLQQFEEVLKRKRECQRCDPRTGIPRRHWFELHWPREESVFTGEKLVTPRRSPINRFACGPAGWYENSDLTVLVRREGIPESIKYLLALLNSAVLEFWVAHRGKKKGKLREYYSTPLREVPLRRIRFEPATPEPRKYYLHQRFVRQFQDKDYDGVYADLASALAADQEDVVHDGLVLAVSRILGLSREPGRNAAEIEGIQSVIDRIVLDLYGIERPEDREAVLAVAVQNPSNSRRAKPPLARPATSIPADESQSNTSHARPGRVRKSDLQ